MKHLSLDITLGESASGDESAREEIVRQIFGMSQQLSVHILHSQIRVPREGLTYVTGYSGTGKSCLLRKIKEVFPKAVTEAPRPCEDSAVIDCLSTEVSETIQWLSQFGLGEARVLLTPVKHLSVGQRQRLDLALLLWSRPAVVIIDEFLSALDRTTARIIAFQFQKLIRRLNITCLVATAHDDLVDALFADATVRLDFEGCHTVTEKSDAQISLQELSEIQLSDGTLQDYEELKRFHYMETQTGDELLNPNDVILIRSARFRGRLVGVRVFTKVFPHSYEKVPAFRMLNKCSALSSRVIVHPVFRGLGISRLIDFPFERFPATRAVFTHSALAKHFPFDAKNYRSTTHTSEERTSHHQAYEQILWNSGLQKLSLLNDPRQAEAFWNSCSPDQQEQIRNHLTAVLTDYDLRYFQYLCQELGIKLPAQAEGPLQSFFRQQVERVPQRRIGSILSEGLFFPMQGLIRRPSESA